MNGIYFTTGLRALHKRGVLMPPPFPDDALDAERVLLAQPEPEAFGGVVGRGAGLAGAEGEGQEGPQAPQEARKEGEHLGPHVNGNANTGEGWWTGGNRKQS